MSRENEEINSNPGMIILKKNTFLDSTTKEMYAREESHSTNAMTELCNRTDNLEATIMIVGCGGIGSWAALYFGSLRTTRDLFLIDPDDIEMSNIGRTPFSIFNVGELKVAALAKMITEKNPCVNTIPIPKYFDEELVEELKGGDHDHYLDVLVIDCRDDFFGDYDMFRKLFYSDIRFLRSAYDGSSVTIDFIPEQTPVQGEGGYTVVASHIMPASLAAQLLVVMALMDTDEDVLDSNMYRIPLTFDSLKLVEYIFMGVMLERLAKNNYKGSEELVDFIINDKNLAGEIVEKNIRVTSVEEGYTEEEDAVSYDDQPF